MVALACGIYLKSRTCATAAHAMMVVPTLLASDTRPGRTQSRCRGERQI
jgi:hypothetical protein